MRFLALKQSTGYSFWTLHHKIFEMTIIQALTATIQVPGVDNLTLEKALIDATLDGAAVYTTGDESKVNTAAVQVLRSLIVLSQSEGGFTYNISEGALQGRLTFLLGKLGELDDKSPSVKAVNVW